MHPRRPARILSSLLVHSDADTLTRTSQVLSFTTRREYPTFEPMAGYTPIPFPSFILNSSATYLCGDDLRLYC